MTSYTIYCTPGDVVSCMAQQWDCTPEVIEEVFGIVDGRVPVSGRETYIRRIVAGIRTLQARGYKKAAYCQGCGHRIMEMELKERK